MRPARTPGPERPRDIRDAFEQALSECGIELPDPDPALARRHALRRLAVGLDERTWAAELRSAAIALPSCPPIGPGC
ncbi:hypothetical protein AB0D54_34025 [Streptomyces xanthophaeus]|uniref:hypothetical protein n=1 Tax=Streptomyces xanthophaeus TaxID=67385 RepID=UPI00343635A7